MAKRILITGGNGYVGRELARLLYDEHEVCIADNLRSGAVRFNTAERSKIALEVVDITDGAAVESLMAHFVPEIVIHLAAIHYIPECEEQPAAALRTNVEGTVNLLLRVPRGCRFVFASSGAVYQPDDRPHNEITARIGPTDVYGLSKLHGEQLTAYFTTQRDLSTVIVRLFNVVGPGETNPHLLPEIIAQLKAGRQTLRLGNLWPKRDYIHVSDAARGFAAVALGGERNRGSSLTVNLGTSKPYSVAEVVAKLQQIAPAGFSLEQEQSRQRKVDRPYLAADIEAIRQNFGWKPQATIDDALADLWREPDLTPALMAKYR